ncbi:GapR family DNA-binding domain-containing protein [Rhizobium ruizarguesonis]
MTAEGQIKSFFQRWETLEAEKQQVADLMKDLFAEAKGFGYDTKALRAAFRLKAKQDLDSLADAEFEAIVDTYMSALSAPTVTARDARMRVREKIEEFDPITGEFVEETPAATYTAVGSGAGSAAPLRDPVANVGEEAADESAAVSVDPASRASEDSERQRASMVGFADDCRTGGKEQAAAAPVPVGEADARSLPANSPEAATKQRANVPPQHEAGNGQATVQNSGVTVVGTERGTVSNSQFDPNEDREEDHSLDGNADANAGGDHVTAQAHRAATAGALVQVAPATKPLRPHCRNPGEHCGGYGSNHCHSCLRAAREPEVAA